MVLAPEPLVNIPVLSGTPFSPLLSESVPHGYLVREHDLLAGSGGLDHSQADLECSHTPPSVVEHWLSVHDRVVQLGDLGLASEQDSLHGHLFHVFVAVDIDAVL